MSRRCEPKTDDEWQDAADAAYFALLVDSARQYGLVTGGPEFDLRRAEQLLERAAARGIRPREPRP